jgi:hypothetical protein
MEYKANEAHSRSTPPTAICRFHYVTLKISAVSPPTHLANHHTSGFPWSSLDPPIIQGTAYMDKDVKKGRDRHYQNS